MPCGPDKLPPLLGNNTGRCQGIAKTGREAEKGVLCNAQKKEIRNYGNWRNLLGYSQIEQSRMGNRDFRTLGVVTNDLMVPVLYLKTGDSVWRWVRHFQEEKQLLPYHWYDG